MGLWRRGVLLRPLGKYAQVTRIGYEDALLSEYRVTTVCGFIPSCRSVLAAWSVRLFERSLHLHEITGSPDVRARRSPFVQKPSLVTGSL